MKPLFEILDSKNQIQKAPPHPKAASVDSIIEVAPLTKSFGYTYWLYKIGKVRYGDVQEIVKNARNLPLPYSKGGYIANKLDELNKRAPRKNKKAKIKISYSERDRETVACLDTESSSNLGGRI